jgi:hypothetical protein
MDLIDDINSKIDYIKTATDVVTSTSEFTATAAVKPAPAPAPVSKASVGGDFAMYVVKVAISIYLIQQVVPSSESYQNLRIIMYILAVLGSGYPLLFLIILYFMKLKIN